MHAVVLIGGFGTRLRPLTDSLPKSMLTVGNEPIITRLVRRLEQSGVTVVTLALGYLPDPFLAAFPGDRCGGVELRYAVEPEPLDTAGAIRFSADAGGVEGTFIVINGDVISGVDIRGLVAAHRERRAEATLHLTPMDDPSAFGVVELDDTSRILRFVEKPPRGTEPSNLINAGMYVMEPSVLDLIETGRRVSVERETFPQLSARGRLYGHATADYWIDAGNPAALLTANLDRLAGLYDTDLDHPCTDGHGVHSGADVAESAVVIDSVIGDGVVVGSRAVIRRSVLLPGAIVGDDVTVDDSIVMGNVGAAAALNNAVIGASASIDPGRRVCDERIPEPA